jgi:cation diffusion facilitator CzcD-associated flavoprotein CzcO
VTIVPNMVDDAAELTMIQRSPSYVFSRPAEDAVANFLNRVLPEKWAFSLTRWKNIYMQNTTFKTARKKPEKVKKVLLNAVRKSLGDDYDVDKHFTPRYNPWEERLCLIPDDDFLTAVREKKAEVVTDTISSFEADGVRLASGRLIEADIVVSATGLNMQFMGGVEFSLDDVALDFSKRFYYQGMMFSGVPNLIQTFGYINASWTLRADLNSAFVCDLLNELDSRGAVTCTPQLREGEKNMQPQAAIDDFNPGYMQRGLHLFPKQGEHAPWRNTQDYLLDRKLLTPKLFEDSALEFEFADDAVAA